MKALPLVVVVLASCGKDEPKPLPHAPARVALPDAAPAIPDARVAIPIVVKEIDPHDPSTWREQRYDGWTILAPGRADAENVLDMANQYVFADAMLVQDTRMPGAPTDLQATLDQAAHAAMPEGAKILAERVVETGGIQGLDVTWKGKAEGRSVKGRARVFVRDAHLFQIEVLYAPGTRADALDRFVESFAFTP